MNINEFKEGDIITRNEPMIYGGNKISISDGSYLGDKFTFLAVDEESKIIFLKKESGYMEGELFELSYARERWNHGWCKYPMSLFEKAEKMCKKEE